MFSEEEIWLDDNDGEEMMREIDKADDFLMDEDDVTTNSSSTSSVLSLEDLSQAFAPNVSYFYLKNELGISEEGMWRITYEASSVLGMTAATVRCKINVLTNAMDLSDADIRTLIESYPTMLQLSADKNLSPKLLFVRRSLDLERDELRQLVLASPSLLSYSMANLKAKFKFFKEVLGYTVVECRELFLSEPKLLRAGVTTGLWPRVRFLVREIEIPIADLRVLVQKHPRILCYSLDGNLVPKLVYYLIMTLQMETSQVRKLLLAYPDFLKYNLNRHIQPITNHFLHDLEYSPTEFRNMLLKYPRLISNSLQKIKHVAGYLRYEVGFTASLVKRVLYQSPQVIGLNTETNLKKKVEFLKQAFALNEDELRTVVTAIPSLLVLNCERNLQPKVDYLVTILKTQENLKQTVLRFPTLLGYSLDKRLRPRMQALLEAGEDPSNIVVGIPMRQDKFDTWLHRKRNKRLLQEKKLREEARLKVQKEADYRSGRIVHWSGERRTRR